MVGMSVVDLHRWDRNKRTNGSAFDWIHDDLDRPEFLKVRSMANLIGQGLRKPQMRYYTADNPRQQPKLRKEWRCLPQDLTRIVDKEGQISRPADGKKGGKGYVRGCLICRQYREKVQNTNWWCSGCHVPLCKKDRGREFSCYDEHVQRLNDPVVGCFTRKSEYIVLPEEYKLYKKANLKDIPILPAFNNNNAMNTMTESAVIGSVDNAMNTMMESAVVDSVDGGGDNDSDSDSDSNSDSNSRELMRRPAAAPTKLTRTAAPTKRRLSPQQSPVTAVRKSKRIAVKSRGRRV
jgi:hypothetical protein